MDYFCKYDYFDHNNDLMYNVISVVTMETTTGVKTLRKRNRFNSTTENSQGCVTNTMK